MKELEVIEQVSKRIDAYMAEKYEDISRVAIQRLIETGKILVNGKKVKASYKVQVNDKITMEEEKAVEVELKAQDIPVEIIFWDLEDINCCK